MEGFDLVKTLTERGLAFGISAAFIVAAFSLIKIGLDYLRKRAGVAPSKGLGIKEEADADMKVQLIVSKALINARADRVNFMKFISDGQEDGGQFSAGFMCCWAEEAAGGVQPIKCRLRHVATGAYPVFVAALQRRRQIMLDGKDRDPNFVDAVYELHDVGKGQALCVAAYDIRQRPVGYVFAKKNAWKDEEKAAISDAASHIGVLLGSVAALHR